MQSEERVSSAFLVNLLCTLGLIVNNNQGSLIFSDVQPTLDDRQVLHKMVLMSQSRITNLVNAAVLFSPVFLIRLLQRA